MGNPTRRVSVWADQTQRVLRTRLVWFAKMHPRYIGSPCSTRCSWVGWNSGLQEDLPNSSMSWLAIECTKNNFNCQFWVEKKKRTCNIPLAYVISAIRKKQLHNTPLGFYNSYHSPLNEHLRVWSAERASFHGALCLLLEKAGTQQYLQIKYRKI